MTEHRLPDLETLKKQNEEFQLTVLTRLARLHHLLEDIQERILNAAFLPPTPSIRKENDKG